MIASSGDMMNSTIKKALFYELHKAIEESASDVVDNMQNCNLTYPPGIEFTEAESKALASLKLSDEAKSGLKKLLKDACSYPSFHFFSLLDGVTDPESEAVEEWYGLSFTEKNENDEMTHDEFYESYWEYENK